MELRDQIHQALGDPDFDSAWASVEGVEGWMTEGQAALLWLMAQPLDGGSQIVEIGSYRGRSMTILGRASRSEVHLVAIDPHAGNDRGPQQWQGTASQGQSDNDLFWDNMKLAGLEDRVEHVRGYSSAAHSEVNGPIDLLYVDGAHGFTPAIADLTGWGGRVKPGGVMLVHDCYSSVGVTLALLRSMTFSGGWTYLGRSRSMGVWRRTPPPSRASNVAKQLAPFGWFSRNLIVKAAIAAHLGPLARLLGSDGKTWPY